LRGAAGRCAVPSMAEGVSGEHFPPKPMEDVRMQEHILPASLEPFGGGCEPAVETGQDRKGHWAIETDVLDSVISKATEGTGRADGRDNLLQRESRRANL